MLQNNDLSKILKIAPNGSLNTLFSIYSGKLLKFSQLGIIFLNFMYHPLHTIFFNNTFYCFENRFSSRFGIALPGREYLYTYLRIKISFTKISEIFTRKKKTGMKFACSASFLCKSWQYDSTLPGGKHEQNVIVMGNILIEIMDNAAKWHYSLVKCFFTPRFKDSGL